MNNTPEMQRSAKGLLHLLWLIYLASYPIAVAGVAFDVRPGFSLAWAGSVLLFVQATLAALALSTSMDWRRGGMVALAVLVGGYIVETIGVTTGFPFGRYRYTEILFPRLPGSVPLPVVCAWLAVAVTAVATARSLIPGRTTARRWQHIGLATVLGVGLDLVLEPVAVHVQHYWIWHTTGPYYGIPTENFLGWSVLCAALSTLLVWGWKPAGETAPEGLMPQGPPVRTSPDDHNFRQTGERRRSSIFWPTAPQARFQPPSFSATMLYVLTAGMFAVIDLTHGLGYAALIGMVIGGALALRWCAAYHTKDNKC
jgi:uncharacterized membrane protein